MIFGNLVAKIKLEGSLYRMAKKIRFPLKMEDDIEVRTLEKLKENFSLERILIYISNGKLVTWLRDRYIDDIADKIEALDKNDIEITKKVFEIFDIEYDEKKVMDAEKIKERTEKLDKLKKYTTEQRFLDVVDNVAFTEDDIYDLLDEEQTEIYLCGERFFIPISKKGINYIGINNPVVIINSKKVIDWNERRITFSDVRYDDKYKQIIDEENKKKEQVNSKKYNPSNNTNIGEYLKNTYLNFMLSKGEQEKSEHCYNLLANEINNLNYDIDDDIMDIKQKLIDGGLVGLAEDYIRSL